MRWPWSRDRRVRFDSQPRPLDLMFTEMLRSSGTTVTRSEALSVPAVRRGRNSICSLATMPLEQLGPDNSVVPSPLLRQLDPDVPNVVTVSQTVEDLLFESVAWWLVTSTDFAGFPMTVRHLSPSQVSVNPPSGRNPSPLPAGTDPRGAAIWVDGQPVSASRIIRFDSPNPAVLKHAGREIRRAILLDKAAGLYADDPRPLDFFSPADGADPVDDDEIAEILRQWKAARKTRTTGYVPAALRYESVDTPNPQQLQLVELQRQASLDIANALGIDPEDLGISTTSRTYSNDVDRRRNRLNEVLSPYMRAVTDRLSMGDVTRRGYTVRFNTTEYLMPNPGERWGIYSTAQAMGALSIDEIRRAEGYPPIPAGDQEVGGDPGLDQLIAPPPSRTFGEGSLTFADVPLVAFSVDRENRVIEGVAVPYDRVASQGGLRFRFEPGSLQVSDVPRVKLLRDHDTRQPLGKAMQLRDTESGFLARFKVARGPDGDRALELAEDGVLDGLSVGVDFVPDRDTVADPRNKGALLVRRADLREVSLVAMPAFDDARVTSVAASRTRGEQGGPVPDTEVSTEAPEAPVETPEPQPLMFSASELNDFLSKWKVARERHSLEEADRPTPVDPTRTLNLAVTREAVPYRFDRGGNFSPTGQYDFSTDLRDVFLSGDCRVDGQAGTDAGRRVMGLLQVTFADVDTADVNELNPNIQRPDLYVDQQDYRYPIWASISKGAPPNGVQPFTFPRFSSASGLVADHVEGTEPTGGSFVTTSQTVTPTAISGKASITREVWDMGGNPAVSTLIFNQMVRGWREGLESAAATFLNTLTAATDINLGVAVVDEDLAAAWDLALAALQFTRGYDWSVFVIEQQLYEAFVDATASDGRKIYPQINPQNATGTASTRFVQLNLGGVVGVPSWALTATEGAANNSWLFDPMFVHGWATTPLRLEFPGTNSTGGYAPVAYVDLAIWGYKALANSDVGAVRQVIYDNA
jgi:HK97 family phage prohead protease